MKKFLKKILNPFLQPLHRRYFSKPRWYQYQSIQVKIQTGVFAPHYTLSTRILLDFIDELNLQSRSLLELGSGSGVISVWAAKKGATVTASDINPKAVQNTVENARFNQVKINVVQSDLFDQLENSSFDYIIVNPPYYPKTPSNDAEKAWFCGQHFEYFQQLYAQLSKNIFRNSLVYLILSEDCDLTTIRGIANDHRLQMQEIKRIRKWWETNYLFCIRQL